MTVNIDAPELPPGYYSIRDPHDADTITHWRKSSKTAVLRSWPPKAKPGPQWSDYEDAGTFFRAWDTYRKAVRATISADPDTAKARFSALSTRCHVCGRALTDERSRFYGIGPDCGKDWTDAELAQMARLMSAAAAQ